MWMFCTTPLLTVGLSSPYTTAWNGCRRVGSIATMSCMGSWVGMSATPHLLPLYSASQRMGSNTTTLASPALRKFSFWMYSSNTVLASWIEKYGILFPRVVAAKIGFICAVGANSSKTLSFASLLEAFSCTALSVSLCAGAILGTNFCTSGCWWLTLTMVVAPRTSLVVKSFRRSITSRNLESFLYEDFFMSKVQFGGLQAIMGPE
mmetsp:Transcript_36302/g.58669  ORF Transcript_36302/g.58669 Transcript_36302/m.58669 type:complete len:206 (+) Transcript_36302:563-1180(+)